MWKFILKRLGLAILQISVLVVAVFFLIRLLPADPVSRFVGMNASKEAYVQAEKSLGLDRSLKLQFVGFLLGDTYAFERVERMEVIKDMFNSLPGEDCLDKRDPVTGELIVG